MTVLLGKSAPTPAAPKGTTLVPVILPPPTSTKPSGAAKEAATLAPVKGGPGYKAPKPSAPANTLGTIMKQAGLKPPPAPKYGLPTLPGSKLKAPATTNAQLKTAMAAQKQAASTKAKTSAIVKALTSGKGITAAAPNLQKPAEEGVLPAGVGPGQVLALPKTFGEGLLETGKAVVHDVAHPAATVEHPLHSETFGLAKGTVTNDPFVKAFKTGSLKPLNDNPLGAMLDVTMAGGAAGKLADVGALGDTAASAFEREPVRVPGTNTLQIRPRLSTNPVFHVGQRLADSHADSGLQSGNLNLRGSRYLTNPLIAHRHGVDVNPQEIKALYQRVDENQHTGDTNMAAARKLNDQSVAAADKDLNGMDNKGVGRDIVGHFEQQLPDNPTAARAMMQKNLDMWNASRAVHDAAKGKMAAGHLEQIPLENLDQNIASMEQGLKLSDSDLSKVIEAARKRQSHQVSEVEAGRAETALGTPEQAERRAVVPYAIQNMGAEHTDNLDPLLSPAGKEHEDVTRQIDEASKEFTKANQRNGVEHPDLKPLAQGIAKTKLKIVRAVAKGDTGTAAEMRKLRDEQIEDYKAQRLKLKSGLSDKINSLKDQQSELATKQHHLKGWVVPTEHMPTAEALRQSIAADEPIHGRSELGHGYKPLDTKEAQEHAKANGITPGYLSGAHPDEEVVRRLKSGGRGAGRGGTSQPYLGDSFVRGTFNGTLRGSNESALSGLRAANKAANYDRTLRDFGLNDDTGALHTFPSDAQGRADAGAIKRQFEEEHPGQKLSLVARYPDRNGNVGRVNDLQGVDEDPAQRLALVHENALKRIDQHTAAKHSVAGLGALNRLWRGGVLPFSANYIQAVPQEGLLRTAMNGINPLRTIPGIGTHILAPRDLNDLMDGLKSASTDERLDPASRAAYKEQHDFLHGLSGGGTMFGSQDQELRDAMQNPDHTPQGAAKLGRKLERLVYKPGQWQLKNMHKLENVQARAVLNDWTKDAKKAQGSMEDLVKAVGDGKNGANLAATAAHRMNDVLGNYVHRSPIEQTLIRNYTPFLPWYKNAIKFVYVTLPRDHPIMASWLAKVGQTNAGIWAQEHKNIAPFLSTEFLGTKYGNALETVDGVDPLRNTPFGVGEESPLSETSLIGPSVLPPLLGALGLNSFGTPIPSGVYGQNIAPGSTPAFTQGVLPNLESMIPYINTLKKAYEGATGHDIAKDSELSHNHALAAIENALGGSLLPKNYGVYSKSSSSGSSIPGAPPGISGSSGAPPGIGSGSGAPPGA
jgi:hypothetical protein